MKKLIILLPVLIILVFALLAGRSLLAPGYFNMHDDLQMMRQLEMEKCFLDLQIPCRWVPDMGYGFGFPLFNYYPPLPYLLGQIFRFAGFSFVGAVKIVFLLSFLFSGIAMYFFSKEFFGKLGGILSSIFYIWAPYRAIDVYVRGAMNEVWSFVWFPLILWTGYRLFISRKKESAKWIVCLALSWAGLFLSHNLMVLIFTPVFVLWMLLFFVREKKWKKIFLYVKSGIIALGLTAFFTLPSFLEQKYVQVGTLVSGYYEYIAHFATVNQLLFSRFWGYGASIWMEKDGMPFQIGHFHWILSLIVLIFLTVLFLRKKKDLKHLVLFRILPLFILIGWISAFMAHSRSIFIWQIIPALKFVQFPWRFLTLVTFSFSFISGSIVLLLKPFGKLRVIIPSFLIILLVIINWNYFLPEGGRMGAMTDDQKFSGAKWDMQRTAGILDYLPITAKENPKGPQESLVDVMEGKAEINDAIQKTNWAKFLTVSDQSLTVRINIFKFPNWRVFIDGKETKISIPETEKWGRMYIKVPEGTHEVYLKLYNTPLRTITNFISLASWLGLIGYLVLQFKRGR